MQTPIQVNDAGVIFQKAGQTINQMVNDNITTLDYSVVQELTNNAQVLLIKSKDLFAAATIDMDDSVQPALQSLQNAQADINKVLSNVALVQSAINIVAQLVSMAGSIIAGNASGTISSAQNVINSVTSALNPH